MKSRGGGGGGEEFIKEIKVAQVNIICHNERQGYKKNHNGRGESTLGSTAISPS